MPDQKFDSEKYVYCKRCDIFYREEEREDWELTTNTLFIGKNRITYRIASSCPFCILKAGIKIYDTRHKTSRNKRTKKKEKS